MNISLLGTVAHIKSDCLHGVNERTLKLVGILGVSEAKGAPMATIHLHQTTTLTPEQYIAGLHGLQ